MGWLEIPGVKCKELAVAMDKGDRRRQEGMKETGGDKGDKRVKGTGEDRTRRDEKNPVKSVVIKII